MVIVAASSAAARSMSSIVAFLLSSETPAAVKQRYSRRERYPQEGMLLQIDGSRHDWLQGRGPYLLIGAVDGPFRPLQTRKMPTVTC